MIFFTALLHENPRFGIDFILSFAVYYTPSVLGACSSAVERQIVDLVVVGSTPTRHPIKA